MLWHCHNNQCLSRALSHALPTLSFPFMNIRVNQEICFKPKVNSPVTSHRESFKLSVSDRTRKSQKLDTCIDTENCHREDDCELVAGGSSPIAGGIVALGKFDALHIGHRELAIQASKVGTPFLLSFVGMAEVLGWEPRAPIVAQCDRKRVLSSWAPFCHNMVPEEYQIEFSSVRHLSPQQFVEKLSKELGVLGVVAGENYRFGYKAAGDTQDLIKLCQEYGMEAYIINCVMDKNQYPRNLNSSNSRERGQVSSTRVRHALATGDMNYVFELLGREHRLVLIADDQKRFTFGKSKLSGPRSCLLNLAPKEGIYEDCSLIVGDQISVPCRVVLDKTKIDIEIDVAVGDLLDGQGFQYISIEFSDSEVSLY